MKKILFLLFFMPLLGISQAKFGGNSVAAARASLKNSNTYTLTYVDGIFYLVSTTTSYPIAFSTVGATGTGNLVYATSPTIASPTITGTLTTSIIANTAGANFATSSGNVGIGTTAPNAPLQFGNTIVNRKIVLFEDTNNDHRYFGFGINLDVLRYQVNTPTSMHVFYAGTGTTTSQKLFSINGNQTVTYTTLTTTQINALTGMTAGTLAYNSTLSMFVFYNGSAWKRMDGTTNM